jgi:S-adenosylmethionine hydrolase
LRLENLTHEIPAFDIWEGAYRLNTTAPYWPPGTVFVSVIDPGVGTERTSVVLKTRSGHYFVSPDNGTLTLVAENLGIAAVREIDESRYRLPGSERSYTFHGRDVYSFAAAHLASGKTAFEDIGPELPPEVASIPYQKPEIQGEVVRGNIPILDVQFGNVWTNIDRVTFERLGVAKGERVEVRILKEDEQVFAGAMPYVSTFGDVPEGETLLYLNSVDNVAFAINWGNFAQTYGVESGPEWRVEVAKR